MVLPFPGNIQDLRRFWQRRYYDFHVHTWTKLVEKLKYMHTNPVKAKLVNHPRDWPWSSWAYYATGAGLLKIDVLKPEMKEEEPTLAKTKPARVGHPKSS